MSQVTKKDNVSGKTAVLELMELSFEQMKQELKDKLDHTWFTNFYIYDINGISSMLYHTLRNRELMRLLISRTGDDDYFGLGSSTGMAMTSHPGVDNFGHSGFSMSQTVFITQQLIRKGIDGVAEFYKAKQPRHPLVSADTTDASTSTDDVKDDGEVEV